MQTLYVLPGVGQVMVRQSFEKVADFALVFVGQQG